MTGKTHTNADDSTSKPPEIPGTYGTFRTGADALVIYDLSNHRAWIESDTAVTITGMA